MNGKTMQGIIFIDICENISDIYGN